MGENECGRVRVIHASDLHVGVENGSCGCESPSCRPLFGAHGHSIEALDGLELRIRDEVDEDGITIVVVSGDLTTHGCEREAEAAFAWLARISSELVQRDTGKRSAEISRGSGSTMVVIPGNHDNFPGRDVWHRQDLPARGHVRGRLPEMPYVHIVDVSEGEAVVLMAIDSDSRFFDPSGKPPDPVASYEREWARGHLGDQLIMLGEILRDETNERLLASIPVKHRVLVVHHSAIGACANGICKVAETCLNELREFADSHRCAVILTGHIHEFGRLECRAAGINPAQAAGKTTYELRSATTAQRCDKRSTDQEFVNFALTIIQPLQSIGMSNVVSKIEQFTAMASDYCRQPFANGMALHTLSRSADEHEWRALPLHFLYPRDRNEAPPYAVFRRRTEVGEEQRLLDGFASNADGELRFVPVRG